jgi:YD repeat-containing protein
MKQTLILLSLLIAQAGYSQMDLYAFFSERIDASDVKTITLYQESEDSPEGTKTTEIQYNEQGQLVTIEEYQHVPTTSQPIVLRQEFKYDEEGRHVAGYIQVVNLKKAPAVDTLIYNDRGEVVKRQMLVEGEVRKTEDYPNRQIIKTYNAVGKIVKLTHQNGESTTYGYNSKGQCTEEISFHDGEETVKHLFEYNADGQLSRITTYSNDNNGNPMETSYTVAYAGR